MAMVTVDIEYQDGDNPFHTSYKATKYPDFAHRVEKAIRDQLHDDGISHDIRLNPGPGNGWEPFLKHRGYYISRWNPLTRIRYPRLGAFEVTVKCSPDFMEDEPESSSCLLSGFTAWSKLKSFRWPHPERLAQNVTRLLFAGRNHQDVSMIFKRFHDSIVDTGHQLGEIHGERMDPSPAQPRTQKPTQHRNHSMVRPSPPPSPVHLQQTSWPEEIQGTHTAASARRPARPRSAPHLRGTVIREDRSTERPRRAEEAGARLNDDDRWSARTKQSSLDVSAKENEIEIPMPDGQLKRAWRLLSTAPCAAMSKALIKRWLAKFLVSSLICLPRIELCYHGTTGEMASFVLRRGFRLPNMHHLIYTTTKLEVANFYASSTSFHSACGAAFETKGPSAQRPDDRARALPGKVFLCLGLNPDVGPAYMKYSKAVNLLPCCVVETEGEAAAAKDHLETIRAGLLEMLPWGTAFRCMRAWALHTRDERSTKIHTMGDHHCDTLPPDTATSEHVTLPQVASPPPTPATPVVESESAQLKVSWVMPTVSPAITCTTLYLRLAGGTWHVYDSGTGSLVSRGGSAVQAPLVSIKVSVRAGDWEAKVSMRNSLGWGPHSDISDAYTFQVGSAISCANNVRADHVRMRRLVREPHVDTNLCLVDECSAVDGPTSSVTDITAANRQTVTFANTESPSVSGHQRSNSRKRKLTELGVHTQQPLPIEVSMENARRNAKPNDGCFLGTSASPPVIQQNVPFPAALADGSHDGVSGEILPRIHTMCTTDKNNQLEFVQPRIDESEAQQLNEEKFHEVGGATAASSPTVLEPETMTSACSHNASDLEENATSPAHDTEVSDKDQLDVLLEIMTPDDLEHILEKGVQSRSSLEQAKSVACGPLPIAGDMNTAPSLKLEVPGSVSVIALQPMDTVKSDASKARSMKLRAAPRNDFGTLSRSGLEETTSQPGLNLCRRESQNLLAFAAVGAFGRYGRRRKIL